MNKLLIAACLALTVVACATQQPAYKADTSRTAGCVPGTTPTPNPCKYPGAVYTQKQLQQTGAMGNTAEALRQLDPSITLR